MYLFFEAAINNCKNVLNGRLLSILGVQDRALSYFFCDKSYCSRKSIEGFSVVELLRFCWAHKYQQPAIMVSFPLKSESDNVLIESFGNSYLGFVSSLTRKSALIEIALKYRQLDQLRGSRRFFSVPSHVVRERLKSGLFTQAEIDGLGKLQDENLSMVDSLIQKKSNELLIELEARSPIFIRGSSLN